MHTFLFDLPICPQVTVSVDSLLSCGCTLRPSVDYSPSVAQIGTAPLHLPRALQSPCWTAGVTAKLFCVYVVCPWSLPLWIVERARLGHTIWV